MSQVAGSRLAQFIFLEFLSLCGFYTVSCLAFHVYWGFAKILADYLTQTWLEHISPYGFAHISSISRNHTRFHKNREQLSKFWDHEDATVLLVRVN
jgi:hypothetical protein